ncbi:MAG TPA: hypothetical protein VHA82_05575 [Ramlibacter sp.]|uniref:hypothetical protein n=1 Tax=Ramlibacter sp. TaxID=1917967 RepID=UPI002BB5209B|nr:hypothetical protein [Ramlibacter sp.]HVZ43261.1 hypothetical protein [Ramlibacter sp.]
MAGRSPPRFVPTLTEVVRTQPPAATPTAATQPSGASPPAAAPAQPQSDPVFLEEQLARSVLRRVDLVLERKLRETIATVVLEHTRTLAPALRERIEAMVRQAVAQALAEEIAAQEHQHAGKPRG